MVTEPKSESHGAAEHDPFTLELVKNRLVSIADEMALTITRTARSILVKEALDFSTALFNAKGDMVAQGTCLPLHLGALPFAVAAVLRRFGDDLHPGDVFALNDPYDGGTHLPDIVCVKPVFVDQTLVGHSACLVHMTDIGGRVPGGNATDSTELFQEGLCLPPVALFRGGQPNQALMDIIARNVRVPDVVLGDLRSQIAACQVGERGLLELIRTYGVQGFIRYSAELLDYTERFTRSEIRKLQAGTYHFSDFLDGDGLGAHRIELRVAVTIADDTMCVDFTGSSPQVRGAINSVLPFTCSAAWACVRSVLDRGIPNNSGYFRPIRIVAPLGTIVNPQAPAAVAARGITAFRLADALFGALAQVRPDLVPAAGGSAPEVGLSFGGHDASGKPFVFVDFLVGSWGGGPWRDGMDGCTGMIANVSNTPTEVVDSELPLTITRYGFVTDSAGAGRWRGGLALQRCIRVLADEAVMQVRSDRRDIPPYGLEGGRSGAASAITIRRADGTVEQPPAKFITTVRKGDEVCVRLASGGGYGDPLERDPQRVLLDVLEHKLTHAAAKADYGVAIGGDPPIVDAETTRVLREHMRRPAPRQEGSALGVQ
jgi:N-methylhydantoinase B